MINFFFGWITKNQFEFTVLDSIVAIIEVFGTFFIVFVLISWIKEKLENRRTKDETKKQI